MSGKSYSGHRIVSRVGATLDPEHMAVLVRRMRIIGACLGAGLIIVSVVLSNLNGGFEWTSWEGGSFRRNSGTGLSYEGTGVVFGALFMIFPLGLGYAFRAATGEVLYLNGTQLTVVRPGRGEPVVLDLTRTLAQVRLDKVPGTRPGSAEARQKVGTHRPVLVLHPESGGRELKIELANLRDRNMRNRQETRMLEAAMRFATDPAIQHVAGQLRTVARWNKLPVVHHASPDAIPASPVDEPVQVPRTPVREGVAAPEIEIVGPN